MEMKYIVTEDEDGKEEFFMFPKSVDHDCFAEVAGRIKNKSWVIGSVYTAFQYQVALQMVRSAMGAVSH